MESIQWRTGLRFLNEAARCLEDKILTSPVCEHCHSSHS